MGTQYHVTVVSSTPTDPADIPLRDDIDLLLQKINQQMSTYIDNSELSLFNQYQETDWFPVSKELANVVSAAQAVSKQTSGLFDVTVSPLIDLWGFGTESKLNLPTDAEINNALKAVGFESLEVRLSPPALRKLKKVLRVDLSAIAKGFAVDEVSTLLSARHFDNYLVEIGGEIRVKGFNSLGKPWRIGIETPNDVQQKVKEYLLLSDISLATSGDYRNYFMAKGRRYSHTINPTTGKPITHNLASVTVLHQSAMLADAYATALSVMGENKGKRFIAQEPHKLHVNLIMREKEIFEYWQNINEVKIPSTDKKCKKWGGCIYLD